MDKILSYTLRDEDMDKTAGGLVNLVLKECVRVTGHEISAAKFIEDGITCEGAKIRVTERILPGQTLRIVLPEERDGQKLIPVEGPVRILYEDEDLIAVDKAAGEVVHPCPGHYQDTVANYLTWHLLHAGGTPAQGTKENPKPDSSGLRIIGRLDKETSGVLIFARNRAAAARLQRQRQEGQFIRTYVAVCEGNFSEINPGTTWGMETQTQQTKRQQAETWQTRVMARGPAGESEQERRIIGTIDHDMEKIPGVLMKMRTCENGKGLHAVTHYEVLAQNKADNTSVVRCRIETGRTHQIRVHMASIGHPLVGDTLYGRRAASEQTLQMEHVKSMAEGTEHALLTAVSVDLLQPFTGQPLHIESLISAKVSHGIQLYVDTVTAFR